MHSLADIPFIVLCGGRGTRIAEISHGIPKAMLPVGGVPFIDMLVEQLAQTGAQDIILCTGVGGGAIAAWLEARASATPRILIHQDAESRGTLFPVMEAFCKFGLDEAIICNGDTLVYGDRHALSDARWLTDELCIVCTTAVGDTRNFGRVVAQGGKLTALEREIPGPGLASNGLIRMRREMLAYRAPAMTALEDLIVAAAADQKVAVLEIGGRFVDIGTPEQYRAVCAS